MSIKIKPKVIVGYLCIYFMLIWNQTNLGENFLKKFSLPILCLFVGLVFIKITKLPTGCGILSIVLILFAVFIRMTVGGIGINAIVSLLSSVYMVAVAVIYNKDKIFDRLVKTIVFLAVCSLILWLFSIVMPNIYNTMIPRYETQMTYRIYSDSINYQEINYGARGLFLYTLREVDLSRNSGIFTEPGIYQMVLNLGIFIILFLNKFLDSKKTNGMLVVLILTLCTTQSTTGFIGLIMIVIFYLFSRTKEKKLFNKSKMVIAILCLLLVLLIDYNIRGSESIVHIAILNKLFSKGTFSLVDNASSAARVGTIFLSIRSILKHPFGIGYTNLGALLNTEKTGFVAAEILSFAAVWGIIPWMFVLWWIFSPLKNKMKRFEIILYVLLYINTLMAQSSMLYPTFIVIPIAFKYVIVNFEEQSE